MQTSKRKRFLETFLGALGARQIIWTDQTEDSISGTVLYDLTDPDEKHDFIWHISESNTPSEKVRIILIYLIDQRLIDIDKIKIPVTKIDIPGIEDEEKEKLFDEMFRVKVNIVKEGQEGDSFFIHD